MEGAQTQVETLESKLKESSPQDAAKPRMPFESALKLTRDQEDALLDHALTRLDQIEGQMGRKTPSSDGGAEFSIEADPNSFIGKREKFTARYYNHVEDRKVPDARPGDANDTIYNHSNLTASLSQRITAQMIAKSATFFYGGPEDTEWLQADPVGNEDKVLAEKIKKFARWKAERCNVKVRHVQGIEFAWVRGEAVIKTTHQERFQIYSRTASVLIDPATGEPTLDAFGDYILEEDAWVDEEAEVPGVTPEGEPVVQMVPTGNRVLKRDGITLMPEVPAFDTREITRKLVTFSGPDSRICYYKDFLCPINATGIQEADLIAHLYDMPVMEVAQMFGGQFAEGDTGVRDFAAAVELLREMLGESNEPKSAAAQPREDFDETDTAAATANPQVQIAECWLRYDANGDGMPEEIVMFVDRARKVPIFYEYTANVTTRGLRPFTVVRPIEVDDRWYGMGAMEYFDPEQAFIDLQINRKNFRDGGSGRVTFWAPWATVEGQANPALRLNHGRTYTLVQGAKAADALTYVTLPDDSGNLMELLELFMQFMQIKSGVLTGADRNVANMPSSETLGEEKLITDAGDELFSMFLMRLHVGLSASLQHVVDMIFANMDRREVFAYFNGDAQEVIELTPEEVKDLAINVRFSITRQKDKQIIESGESADRVIAGYYGAMPILQERLTHYARARLKALRVPHPDEVIEPLPPEAYPPPADVAAP
jgi:hypothetical protein